jgi:hypothetical protein
MQRWLQTRDVGLGSMLRYAVGDSEGVDFGREDGGPTREATRVELKHMVGIVPYYIYIYICPKS